MESKNKTVEISLVKLIFILIIIAALIAGIAVMYFYYRDEMKNKQNTEISSASTNAETQEEKKETKETKDITSKEIRTLYKYIPVFNSNKIEKNAYQTQRIRKGNLTEEYLLANVFTKIKIVEADKKPYINGNGEEVEGWYSFDANLLQEVAEQMYGGKINNVSFEIGYGQSCTYENGEYKYSAGGSSSEDMQNIRTIEEAYEEEETLYIIDKYIVLKNNQETADINGTEENAIEDIETSTAAKIYVASDSTTPIATEKTENIPQTTEEIEKYIKEKYSSKMQKYKHTFKKNKETGKYYWYSTEPIEE